MSTFDRIRIIKRYLFVFVVAFEEVCKVEGIAVVSGVVAYSVLAAVFYSMDA